MFVTPKLGLSCVWAERIARLVITGREDERAKRVEWRV